MAVLWRSRACTLFACRVKVKSVVRPRTCSNDVWRPRNLSRYRARNRTSWVGGWAFTSLHNFCVFLLFNSSAHSSTRTQRHIQTHSRGTHKYKLIQRRAFAGISPTLLDASWWFQLFWLSITSSVFSSLSFSSLVFVHHTVTSSAAQTILTTSTTSRMGLLKFLLLYSLQLSIQL